MKNKVGLVITGENIEDYRTKIVVEAYEGKEGKDE